MLYTQDFLICIIMLGFCKWTLFFTCLCLLFYFLVPNTLTSILLILWFENGTGGVDTF